ncbi:MAG TPA: Wzt carbohydrate-binding domain-containing protein, partial [Longimicrobiaceae bacterium]
VSHDLGAVRAYCRRALCLDAGELVADGPVDEVAERYLARLRGAAGAGEGEAVFAEEPERRAQVTRVRVLGADGEPRAAHDLLEPVRVEVEFVVHRPFPSLVLRCTVLARGGQVVLTSRETDWANHAGPEMGAPLPKAPGRHVATLALPAPLLQAGVYEVQAALTVPRVEMVDERGGVFFELEDRGSFAGFPAPRRGLLAIPLAWDVRALPL